MRFCLSGAKHGWASSASSRRPEALRPAPRPRVFDEVRRVLRSNGTLWLNLGDTFQGDRQPRSDDSSLEAFSDRWDPLPDSWQGAARDGALRGVARSQAQGPRGDSLAGHPRAATPTGLVAPVGLRLGEAQSDARNPVMDPWKRRSHEYVFLPDQVEARVNSTASMAVQSARYRPATDFVCPGGIRVANPGGLEEFTVMRSNRSARRALVNLKGRMMAPQIEEAPGRFSPLGANLRSVWWIPTHGYPECPLRHIPETLAESTIRRPRTTESVVPGSAEAPLPAPSSRPSYKFLSKPLNPVRPRPGFETAKPWSG